MWWNFAGAGAPTTKTIESEAVPFVLVREIGRDGTMLLELRSRHSFFTLCIHCAPVPEKTARCSLHIHVFTCWYLDGSFTYSTGAN